MAGNRGRGEGRTGCGNGRWKGARAGVEGFAERDAGGGRAALVGRRAGAESGLEPRKDIVEGIFSFSGFQGIGSLCVFSLSSHLSAKGAPESHSAGTVCHLRQQRPLYAVKKASFSARQLFVGDGLSGLELIGRRLVPKEPPI